MLAGLLGLRVATAAEVESSATNEVSLGATTNRSAPTEFSAATTREESTNRPTEPPVAGLPIVPPPTNAAVAPGVPAVTNEVRRTTGSRTDPTATPASPPNPRDYGTFKLITDRNIFSPSRSGRSTRPGPATPKKVPKVETVSLVGIMGYDKSMFAFFDGSSAEFKKVLKPAEVIAGHQIMAINADQVTLVAGGREVALRPGMQLRREDEGNWLPVSPEAMVTRSSGVAKAEPEASGSDAEAEILKKLMQKREQEMNK